MPTRMPARPHILMCAYRCVCVRMFASIFPWAIYFLFQPFAAFILTVCFGFGIFRHDGNGPKLNAHGMKGNNAAGRASERRPVLHNVCDLPARKLRRNDGIHARLIQRSWRSLCVVQGVRCEAGGVHVI